MDARGASAVATAETPASNPPASAARGLARAEARLARWPRGVFLVAATAATLVLVIFFFSPRWFVFATSDATTFQWNRGLNFAQQAEQPWSAEVEPALRWRLLPPLVAHALGLRGVAVFSVSWLGIVALALAIVHWGERWLGSRVGAFALAVLIASTSAVLVPIGWLGINDAWVWLGLLALTLARAPAAMAIACVLCPWIDERFIIGFPLAVWCGARLRGEERNYARRLLTLGCWLAPYVIVRGLVTLLGDGGGAAGFLRAAVADLPATVPLMAMGWWFGLRAAWAAGVFSVIEARSNGGNARAVFEVALVGITCGVSAFLAHDLSRSVAILIPWIAAGAIAWQRAERASGARALVLLAALNLVLPAAHVVERWIDVISPLPIELYRVLN